MVGWGVWRHTYRRAPRCGVVLRVLVPVPVAGSCSVQGWGARGLCGARQGYAVRGGARGVARPGDAAAEPKATRLGDEQCQALVLVVGSWGAQDWGAQGLSVNECIWGAAGTYQSLGGYWRWACGARGASQCRAAWWRGACRTARIGARPW